MVLMVSKSFCFHLHHAWLNHVVRPQQVEYVKGLANKRAYSEYNSKLPNGVESSFAFGDVTVSRPMHLLLFRKPSSHREIIFTSIYSRLVTIVCNRGD